MQTVNNTTSQKFIMNGYLYVHRAMRQDISNLERAAVRAGTLNDEDAARLQRWFQFFWEMVEGHHVEEDNNFFPDIARRDPAFMTAMERLTADHQELHTMVNEIAAILKNILATEDTTERVRLSQQLTSVATRFREALHDHLDREEKVVIESISRHFSEKEQKAMEQRTMKSTPVKHLSLLVPWIASTMNAEEAKVALKVLPLPMRWLYRLSWRKKYQKFTAVLFA